MKKIDTGEDGGKTRTIEFNDFDDFLHTVRTAPLNSEARASSRTTSKSERWDMSAGWDGANELANRGWSAGLAKMARVRDLVDLPDQSDRSIQAQAFYSDEGDEVDIDRYLDGEPECMIQFTPELTPSYGRVAKIIVNMAASCGVDAATQYHRGAAACILIDALESAGVRCEVWCLPFCSREGRDRFVSKILVKRPDQHVEPDRMAYMLAHPAVMRRFGFRLLEQQGRPWVKWTKDGYGHPMDLPRSETEEDGTIYFDRQYGGYGNERDMIRSVNELLKKYIITDKETPEYA
jgi:hypothetical protein